MTSLSYVSGEVFVNGESAKEGVRLKEGDSIVTGKRGEAMVTFFDESVSRVVSGSELVLTSLEGESSEKSNVSFSLIAGTVWSKVMKVISPDSQFSVQAGETIAAV